MKTLKPCEWCDSKDTEVVGYEYSGHQILHCKRCSHEFYGVMDKEAAKKVRKVKP